MQEPSMYIIPILFVAVAYLVYSAFSKKKNNSSDSASINSIQKSDKQKIKDVKLKVSTGIAENIDPKDYQKVIIEQNEAIIGLLGLQVVNSSGLGGDAFAMIHQDRYYKNIEKYIKKEKKSADNKKDSE